MMYVAGPAQTTKPSVPEVIRQTRVGLIVGRPVGNSVARHRVARVIRHRLASQLASLPPGSNVVVRALPGSGGRPNATISVDLDRCLAAVGGLEDG